MGTSGESGVALLRAGVRPGGAGDRERIRRMENRLPGVGQKHPGTPEEAVFLAAFVDNPTPAGEFRGRENPAPG